MRKVLVILLVLTLSLSFVSCNKEKKNENDAAPVQQTEQSGGNAPVQQSQEEPEKTPDAVPVETPAPAQNVEALELARQGKVTGLNVGIGNKLQDAVSELGEPITLDYYEGTSFVSYEVVDLMLDRIIEDTKSEAYISGIIVAEGYSLYGVKVGMSPEAIKLYLGEPATEGQEADGEGELWKMDYDCGDYTLSFFATGEDSATLSAYLSKKE